LLSLHAPTPERMAHAGSLSRLEVAMNDTARPTAEIFDPLHGYTIAA
jgi:hypothetical protein